MNNELNRAIAEKAMGFKVIDRGRGGLHIYTGPISGPLPDFSGNIVQAYRVKDVILALAGDYNYLSWLIEEARDRIDVQLVGYINPYNDPNGPNKVFINLACAGKRADLPKLICEIALLAVEEVSR